MPADEIKAFLTHQLKEAVLPARHWKRFLSIRTKRIVNPWGALYLRWTGRPWLVRCNTFFNVPMMGVLGEVVFGVIYKYGFYEPDLTYALIQLLNPGDTMIDVGGHLGYFSRLAEELVGPSGRVVAFEPAPRTRSLA